MPSYPGLYFQWGLGVYYGYAWVIRRNTLSGSRGFSAETELLLSSMLYREGILNLSGFWGTAMLYVVVQDISG